MISEVYNIDCLEYMRSLPDKYFDLCIADPPYGIGASKMTMGTGKKNWIKKDWDSSRPSQEVLDEMFRVSKNQIIWGGNYFNLPLNGNWIVWDKLNPNLSFAEGELAWCSIHKNLRIFKYFTGKKDDGDRIHPTQKPIALYSWILDNYAIGGGAKSLTRSWVPEAAALQPTRKASISTLANLIKNTTRHKKSVSDANALAR